MQPNTISMKYPPLIDPTRTPIAYGREAFYQLNIQMQSDNIVTKQRALRALSDLVHDAENTYTCITIGLTHKLVAFLGDPDDVLRSLAIDCIFTMSGHSYAREFIVSEGFLQPIATLVAQTQLQNIRKLAHGTLERVSTLIEGSEGLIVAGMVSKLVLQAAEEIEDIKMIVLDTLHNCLKLNTSLAIEHGAIKVFLTLLGNPLYSIRAKAARNLMDLAVSLDGKNKAVDQGSIPVILKLLNDENDDVRGYGCAALMLLTVITKGKYAAVENGAVECLLPQLENKSDHVKTNALKCLTCLAEVPSVRQSLLSHLDKVSELINTSSPHVSRVARTALNVITWTP